VSRPILQAGNPVLRQRARALTKDEILSPEIQSLIDEMRETMREAPGVGLAAPQIGLPLQLAVVEDRPELLATLPSDKLLERQRQPVPFQVLINPVLVLKGPQVEFFEGCLSVRGFAAVVPRSLRATVECLNQCGEPVRITAIGWHARILQHEVDHLNGTLYLDHMYSRTFTSQENLVSFWNDLPVQEVLRRLIP
jgi:peptide deformylase